MAFLSLRPAVVEFIDMVTLAPSLRLEEIAIRPGSPLAGTNVGDARAEYPGATVLAVKKEGAGLLPSPSDSTTFAVGDLVVVMGAADALESMAR